MMVALYSWPGIAGQRAEFARGDLRVLRTDGLRHVGRRQTEGRKALGLEPQAHRILGAEQNRLAHARRAADASSTFAAA